MPVGFLSDEQVAAYGKFNGVPSRAELERFFFLDDADQQLVRSRRGEDNRLGFALQLGTVRFLGAFLPDPLDVPGVVLDYVADQLGVGDPSVVKGYLERRKTAYEHSWRSRRRTGTGSSPMSRSPGSCVLSSPPAREPVRNDLSPCSIRRLLGCAPVGCCSQESAFWPGWSLKFGGKPASGFTPR